MGRATFLHVKSTILHCPPSKLPGYERQLIANCYADREMSVITTYLNDNAQTSLNRFVVYMLYSQLCNRYSDKSNRWSLGLSLIVASSTVGAISNSPSSMTLLIAVNECRAEFFSVHSCAHKNGSRKQNHDPFRGDLSLLWKI